MKTTKIAASLLSLSIILPGLIVSNSVPAQAQNNPCPDGYNPHKMEQGDTLFKLARSYTKDANSWKLISKPGNSFRPYKEKEASNLAAGDIVCLPDDW